MSEAINNSNKIILDLCGGTGAWSKPYKDAGYTVELTTLPEYDVTRVEFNDHAIRFERMDVHWYDCLTVLYEDIYGILAAPPCTQFSIARTTAKTPRDFVGGMEVVRACLDIIWRCQYDHKLAFWAMENPRGMLRRFMGRPAFNFEQWEFGDTGVKPTDIWGYFNPPAKIVSARPEGMTKIYPNGRANSVYWNKTVPGLSAADVRAITPPGFAEAFYKANK